MNAGLAAVGSSSIRRPLENNIRQLPCHFDIDWPIVAFEETIAIGSVTAEAVRTYHLTVNSILSMASNSVAWSDATTRISRVCLPGLMPLSVPFSLSNMPISSPST